MTKIEVQGQTSPKTAVMGKVQFSPCDAKVTLECSQAAQQKVTVEASKWTFTVEQSKRGTSGTIKYSAGDWTVSQKVQDPALLLTPTINLKRSLTKNFKIEAEKCYHDRHVLASMTAKVSKAELTGTAKVMEDKEVCLSCKGELGLPGKTKIKGRVCSRNGANASVENEGVKGLKVTAAVSKSGKGVKGSIDGEYKALELSGMEVMGLVPQLTLTGSAAVTGQGFGDPKFGFNIALSD